MRLRKQTASGDYQFGHNGGDIWFNQIELVGQSLRTRLLLFTGEWFLDLGAGTPWGGFPLNQRVVREGQILGAHTAQSRDAALKTTIIGTPGVLSLTSYASQGNPNTRSFSVQAVVDTIFGRLALSLQPSPRPPARFLLDWSALTGADGL